MTSTQTTLVQSVRDGTTLHNRFFGLLSLLVGVGLTLAGPAIFAQSAQVTPVTKYFTWMVQEVRKTENLPVARRDSIVAAHFVNFRTTRKAEYMKPRRPPAAGTKDLDHIVALEARLIRYELKRLGLPHDGGGDTPLTDIESGQLTDALKPVTPSQVAEVTKFTQWLVTEARSLQPSCGTLTACNDSMRVRFRTFTSVRRGNYLDPSNILANGAEDVDRTLELEARWMRTELKRQGLPHDGGADDALTSEDLSYVKTATQSMILRPVPRVDKYTQWMITEVPKVKSSCGASSACNDSMSIRFATFAKVRRNEYLAPWHIPANGLDSLDRTLDLEARWIRMELTRRDLPHDGGPAGVFGTDLRDTWNAHMPRGQEDPFQYHEGPNQVPLPSSSTAGVPAPAPTTTGQVPKPSPAKPVWRLNKNFLDPTHAELYVENTGGSGGTFYYDIFVLDGDTKDWKHHEKVGITLQPNNIYIWGLHKFRALNWRVVPLN